MNRYSDRERSVKRFQVFVWNHSEWVAVRVASRNDVLLGLYEEKKHGAVVDALPVGETATLRTAGHTVRLVRLS